MNGDWQLIESLIESFLCGMVSQIGMIDVFLVYF